MSRSNKGGALKAKYEYMILHGKSKKKAVVAIARKMAELIYTLIKNNDSFDQRPFTPRESNVSDLAADALSAAGAA